MHCNQLILYKLLSPVFISNEEKIATPEIIEENDYKSMAVV